MNFKDLPLHDAKIISLKYVWKSKIVKILGERYNTSTDNIDFFQLEFLNVIYLSIPQSEEWGPSESILKTIKIDSSDFRIQMQSGDLIIIHAGCFTFE